MAKAKVGRPANGLVAGQLPTTKAVVRPRKDGGVPQMPRERGPKDLLPWPPWSGPPVPQFMPGWPQL